MKEIRNANGELIGAELTEVMTKEDFIRRYIPQLTPEAIRNAIDDFNDKCADFHYVAEPDK